MTDLSRDLPLAHISATNLLSCGRYGA